MSVCFCTWVYALVDWVQHRKKEWIIYEKISSVMLWLLVFGDWSSDRASYDCDLKVLFGHFGQCDHSLLRIPFTYFLLLWTYLDIKQKMLCEKMNCWISWTGHQRNLQIITKSEKCPIEHVWIQQVIVSRIPSKQVGILMRFLSHLCRKTGRIQTSEDEEEGWFKQRMSMKMSHTWRIEHFQQWGNVSDIDNFLLLAIPHV